MHHAPDRLRAGDDLFLVRPTRQRVLWAALVSAAVVSWSVLSLLDSRGGALLPALPWSAPVALLVLAVLVAAASLGVRRRLRQRSKDAQQSAAKETRVRSVNALVVARLAVLGKASAYGGAVLAGAYAGYVVLLVSDLSTELRRGLGLIAGLSALAAVLLAAAGLALERSCRVPPDEGGEEAALRQIRPS